MQLRRAPFALRLLATASSAEFGVARHTAVISALDERGERRALNALRSLHGPSGAVSAGGFCIRCVRVGQQ
jgi:hypothetical protein